MMGGGNVSAIPIGTGSNTIWNELAKMEVFSQFWTHNNSMLFGDNIFLCRHGFGNTWRVLHLRYNVHLFFDNLFIFKDRV